jgi:glutathione peroxidase
MKLKLLGVFASLVMSVSAASIHDFSLPAIDGKQSPLSAYKGKVMLVVNVASQCGLTPQYKGLQSLYSRYSDKGLVVVGFPANNFGAQEPGSNEEIKQFCSRNYRVTFPMYSKISVKGPDQAPLYKFLTSQTSGDIQWNFTKFLIDKNGKILHRFEPNVDPESSAVVAAIEAALK